MLQFDTRRPSGGAAAATADQVALSSSEKALSPAALQITEQQIAPAYSPIVLAGTVRLIEFSLIALVGLVLYAVYVIPVEGFEWHYVAAIFAIATMAMLALQAADTYQVQAFRGHEKQYFRLASGWSVVFLIAISVTFFAKAGDEFSRIWLGGFYVAGLVVLITFRRILFLLVRQWTREGRLDRRTVVVGCRCQGREPDQRDRRPARQRRAHRRRVRRSRRRSLAHDRRRPPEARHRRRSGRIRPSYPHRSRDLLAADLGRGPHPPDAEEAVGAAGRHPARRPFNKLRFRPRAYSYIGNVPVLDVVDKPITDWDVVMKWLFDQVVGSLLLLLRFAAHADHRDRHQARQPRPDFLQAEALRLQQRADRGLQVPLDVRGQVRRHGLQAGAAQRPARHPGRRLHPQDLARRAAAAHQRRVQGQPVAGRPAPARDPRQGRRTASTTRRSTAISRAIACKPGITGWAQINGWRGETDTHEKIQRRVEHDLYYIENWSVLFDLYILAKTPFALANTENAY